MRRDSGIMHHRGDRDIARYVSYVSDVLMEALRLDAAVG